MSEERNWYDAETILDLTPEQKSLAMSDFKPGDEVLLLEKLARIGYIDPIDDSLREIILLPTNVLIERFRALGLERRVTRGEAIMLVYNAQLKVEFSVERAYTVNRLRLTGRARESTYLKESDFDRKELDRIQAELASASLKPFLYSEGERLFNERNNLDNKIREMPPLEEKYYVSRRGLKLQSPSLSLERRSSDETQECVSLFKSLVRSEHVCVAGDGVFSALFKSPLEVIDVYYFGSKYDSDWILHEILYTCMPESAIRTKEGVIFTDCFVKRRPSFIEGTINVRVNAKAFRNLEDVFKSMPTDSNCLAYDGQFKSSSRCEFSLKNRVNFISKITTTSTLLAIKHSVAGVALYHPEKCTAEALASNLSLDLKRRERKQLIEDAEPSQLICAADALLEEGLNLSELFSSFFVNYDEEKTVLLRKIVSKVGGDEEFESNWPTILLDNQFLTLVSQMTNIADKDEILPNLVSDERISLDFLKTTVRPWNEVTSKNFENLLRADRTFEYLQGHYADLKLNFHSTFVWN